MSPGGVWYGDTLNGHAPDIAYSDLFGAGEDSIICFTANTLIETSEGNKPVEELQPGDMIATMDDGYQPIRWIGSTKRDAIDLARNPKLRPIRISAGALGNGLPKQDLMVSRQHRVLVRSKIAQRIFGTDEILIPAIKLVGMNGIGIAEDIEDVTYFHILFDRHQVIFSEDAPTESLFTGPEALKSMSPAAAQEIRTLFPEITEPDFIAEPIRPIPGKGIMMKQLVERHRKNGISLLNG
ncbi:Hint domain-containing protein [Paracoccus saliphilus]|nr:Hint domain-containing protein [Paracoccus saliphilus]